MLNDDWDFRGIDFITNANIPPILLRRLSQRWVKTFHTVLGMWILKMGIDMSSARMAEQWLCVVDSGLGDLTTKSGGE